MRGAARRTSSSRPRSPCPLRRGESATRGRRCVTQPSSALRGGAVCAAFVHKQRTKSPVSSAQPWVAPLPSMDTTPRRTVRTRTRASRWPARAHAPLCTRAPGCGCADNTRISAPPRPRPPRTNELPPHCARDHRYVWFTPRDPQEAPQPQPEADPMSLPAAAPEAGRLWTAAAS